MKKSIIVTLVLSVGLFASASVHAQGTLYLSNLGQTPITNMVVGSDSWLAVSFTTGTNSGGYSLNSLQLLMGAASGNPGSLTVSLFDNFPVYGSSLGILNGSTNPLAPGIYTYTASGITLLPARTYTVMLTTTTPTATGAYDWNAGSTGFTSLQKWGYYLSYTSSDGLNWGVSRSYFFQAAIYATPVPTPEPGTGALICLGLAGLSLWRRKRRDVHS